jgi:hypothetical protein
MARNIINQLNHLKDVKQAIRDAINSRGTKLTPLQPFEDYSQEILDMLLNAVDEIHLKVKNNNGILIPMYIFPTFDGDGLLDGDYATVISLKRKYPNIPIYTILNPNSGPGVSVDGSYTSAVKQLIAAGVHVLGYVSLAYPYDGDVNTVTRNSATIKTDIDNWKSLYPDIEGLFFDELTYLTSSATYKTDFQNFMVDLRDYAYTQELNYIVANAGTSVEEWYFTEEKLADNIIIYENTTYPTEDSLRLNTYNSQVEIYQRGVLVYGSALEFDRTQFEMIKKYAGLIFINDGNAGWGNLSSNLDQQVRLIETTNVLLPISRPSLIRDGDIWME